MLVKSSAKASVSAQNEIQAEIDITWTPELRYQDFLRTYLLDKQSDMKMFEHFSRKLGTNNATLKEWLIRDITKNKEKLDYLSLAAGDEKIRNEIVFGADIYSNIIEQQMIENNTAPQVLFCGKNCCLDIYWPSTVNNRKMNSTFILINDEYIAWVMKYACKESNHLRACVIIQISDTSILNQIHEIRQMAIEDNDEIENSISSLILEHFPMNIEWETVNYAQWNLNHAMIEGKLLNSQNILSLDYNIIDDKSKKISNAICFGKYENYANWNADGIIINSTGDQILLENEIRNENEFVNFSIFPELCEQKMEINSNSINNEWIYDYHQQNDNIFFFKKDGNSMAKNEMFLSGIKCIDFLNPLKKNGINFFIVPNGYRWLLNDIFTKIANIYHKQDNNRHEILYCDIFDNHEQALECKENIMSGCPNNGNGVTIVAGQSQDSDWSKFQSVLTTNTIAHSMPEHFHDTSIESLDILCMFPNANIINKCMNNLHRDICGGFSAAKYELSNEMGLKAYDTTLERKLRSRPKNIQPFLDLWGIKSSIVGKKKSIEAKKTYLIGIELDEILMKDSQIPCSAYFHEVADSVCVFSPKSRDVTSVLQELLPNILDMRQSTSKILSDYVSKQFMNKCETEEEKEKIMNENEIEFQKKQWKVMNGIRRLYSNTLFIKKLGIVSRNLNQQQSRILNLYQEIFEDWTIDDYGWPELIDILYNKLVNEMDNNGTLFLECNCLNSIPLSPLPSKTSIDAKNDIIMNANSTSAFDEISQLFSDLRLDDLETENKKIINPKLHISSTWTHEGLLASQVLVLNIVLYSDESMKHAMNVGSGILLFVNEIPVIVPSAYTSVKSSDIDDEMPIYVKDDIAWKQFFVNSDQSTYNSEEKFVDCEQTFGISVKRYRRGSEKNRYDYIYIHGILRQDITDISVFIHGFESTVGNSMENIDDEQQSCSYLCMQRCGPDLLPAATKTGRSKRLKKYLVEIANENEKEFDTGSVHILKVDEAVNKRRIQRQESNQKLYSSLKEVLQRKPLILQ